MPREGVSKAWMGIESGEVGVMSSRGSDEVEKRMCMRWEQVSAQSAVGFVGSSTGRALPSGLHSMAGAPRSSFGLYTVQHRPGAVRISSQTFAPMVYPLFDPSTKRVSLSSKQGLRHGGRLYHPGRTGSPGAYATPPPLIPNPPVSQYVQEAHT